MPKLWNDSIEAHRHAVREAILDTTWTLVTEHGLLSVTMSQIAKEAGVGRATLYKYFPDVETILAAWHERHTAGHLERLAELAARGRDVDSRLRAVLDAYAQICHHRGAHAAELQALVHTYPHVTPVQQQLVDLVTGLVAEAAAQGYARSDIPPAELAGYCVHALATASDLPSKAAVHRLLRVTIDGLRPPQPSLQALPTAAL